MNTSGDFYVLDSGRVRMIGDGLCAYGVEKPLSGMFGKGDEVVFERGRATSLFTPPLMKIHKKFILGYITD